MLKLNLSIYLENVKIFIMKINIKETLVNKFIETKDLNILIANIYNTYFEECRKNIDEFSIIKHKETDNPIYYALLEALEIDSSDFEFEQLSKQYHLSEIIKLDYIEYLNNSFIKDIRIENKEFAKYSLKKNYYSPYECFLYSEIKVKDSAFYKEINNLGYFDKQIEYYELLKGDTIISEINPFEINITNNFLADAKGKVLVYGLGLGYFPYMASLKKEVSSIDVYEKDSMIIEIFNTLSIKDKIKVFNIDLFKNFEKISNDYDYIYFDFNDISASTLIKYIFAKKYETNFANTKFLYKNEVTLLALLRRYVVVLFEENLNGFTDKNYQKSSSDEDKIINALYNSLKKEVFNNRQSIDKLLSDQSLKTLVKKLDI